LTGKQRRLAGSFMQARLPWIGYCAATVAYCVLVVMSGDGIRGTDQWWYAREAQTVIDGDPKISNEVYPYPFLLNHRVDNPFMHHTLSLYFVAAGAKILGVARGWRLAAALAAVVAAACTAIIVRDLTQRRDMACLAYAVFLLNPLTVWQSTNLLMEVFYGMFLALVALQYTWAGACRLRWTLLCATLCLGAACHPVFVLLLLGLPLAFLFHVGRPVQVRNLAVAAGFLFLGLLAIAVSRLLFDNSLPPTIAGVVHCSSPHEALMGYYFKLHQADVTIAVLWTKFLHAMTTQFWVMELATAPLFWCYNLAAAGSWALLLVSWRDAGSARQRRLAFLACLGFAMHMAYISLHVPQFRTGLTFLAPHVACAAVVLTYWPQSRQLGRGLLTAVASVLIVAFLAADTLGVRAVRRDAAASRWEQEALSENLAAIPGNERVVVQGTLAGCLPITYAAYPRKTLILSVDFPYPADDYITLQRAFQAKWLICLPGSPLPALWGAEKAPLRTPFRGRMSNLAIYHLPSGGSGNASGSTEP
jgi:hypothetical protein